MTSKTSRSANDQWVETIMTLKRWKKAVVAAGLAMSLYAQAEPIATVEVIDGAVTVQRATGKRMVLAVGSKLEEGDVVSTEKDSYVRLRFTDGGEMAVRPQSTLNIQQYRFQTARPAQDSLVINLVKGGMRTVTGLIGKRGNENAYRVQGTTATIGIRGTEYVVRECKGDCAVERKNAGPLAVNGAASQQRQKGGAAPLAVAARIASFAGQVTIRDGAKSRIAVAGEPLYSGETVIVSKPGHAAMEFNDKTRVVLDQGSEYQITSVRFNPEAPASGNVLTSLVKGGLRMMTGVLGKRRPENVKVDTVVATIGIRGTNFDIWCVPTGKHHDGQSIRLPDQPHTCNQGLYAATREGAIEMVSGEYSLVVPAGRIGYVDGPGQQPVLLDAEASVRQRAPAPESLSIDHAALFGADGRSMNDPGMYVSVKEGVVALMQANGEELLLHRGEVGYAGAEGGDILLLENEPEFIKNDLYLREMNVDPSTCRAQ